LDKSFIRIFHTKLAVADQGKVLWGYSECSRAHPLERGYYNSTDLKTQGISHTAEHRRFSCPAVVGWIAPKAQDGVDYLRSVLCYLQSWVKPPRFLLRKKHPSAGGVDAAGGRGGFTKKFPCKGIVISGIIEL
jgi:hypothetical protein